GIPALITVLDAPSVALAWQAEELLQWAAGGGAPKPTVGSGSALDRKKCREAWEVWWHRSGSQLKLEQQDERRHTPRLLLVCTAQRERGSTESRVMLYGCDAKPRWEIRTSSWVREARLQPGDYLLLAENRGKYAAVPRDPNDFTGISERELSGAI